MRIVAMGDTHGYHRELIVPDGDVLIHAGDLTRRGTAAQIDEVAEWLRSLPHRHKIIVGGNHDFWLQGRRALAKEVFAGCTYLDEEELTVEGVRFFGSPWTPWFHDWAFNAHRGAEIDEKWQRIPEGTDVLITHGPPLGMGDLVHDGERVGCADLLRHLSRVKPKVQLFGHIHEDRGEWQHGPTRVINCTVAECELPCTVIDV